MIDPLDRAAIAVADIAAVVVSLDQDAVANGERRAGCQQLVRCERADRAQDGSGAGVELCDDVRR